MTLLQTIAVWAVALSAVEFAIAAVANAVTGNKMFALFYLGLVIVNGSLAVIQSTIK